MYNLKSKVLWFAVTSRLIVFGLQFLFNLILSDHDAGVFISPRNPLDNLTNYDIVTNYLFSGLCRWDGQYFLHIARYGYTYENTLAFYPLYPLLIRYLSIAVKPIFFAFNQESIILLSAVTMNFIFFVKSAMVLHELSTIVLKDSKLAYKAAILYCINPASIFFSAFYSESMFAYLSFHTMLSYAKNNPYIYVPISLSTIVRSNGLINIGFPAYRWLRFAVENVRDSTMPEAYYGCRTMIRSFCRLVNIVVLSITPYILLQIYNYISFCTPSNDRWPEFILKYGDANELLIAGQVHPPWCNYTIPIAYSYVQNKYWDVGFMRYYTLKQVPNFVLASPILYIIFTNSIKHFIDYKELYGLSAVCSKKTAGCSKNCMPDIFVFIIHGLFLTIFCMLFVHIQVSTRLLCSASPLLYWYCAKDMSHATDTKSKSIESFDNMHSKWKVFFFSQTAYTTRDKIILFYFSMYFVTGCFMFSNFLPWT